MAKTGCFVVFISPAINGGVNDGEMKGWRKLSEP
jgi:hypothetical protein